MKSKIVRLGEKDLPVRIWVGKDGFYIEYLGIKNYANLSDEEMNYLAKLPPKNWQEGTPIFFAYMKDIVAYALKHTQFLAEKKKEENTTDINNTNTTHNPKIEPKGDTGKVVASET